jgi:hypothetical protein
VPFLVPNVAGQGPARRVTAAVLAGSESGTRMDVYLRPEGRLLAPNVTADDVGTRGPVRQSYKSSWACMPSRRRTTWLRRPLLEPAPSRGWWNGACLSRSGPPQGRIVRGRCRSDHRVATGATTFVAQQTRKYRRRRDTHRCYRARRGRGRGWLRWHSELHSIIRRGAQNVL